MAKVGTWRQIPTIPRLQLTKLRRQTLRRLQRILITVHNSTRHSTADSIPTDVVRRLRQSGVDVQQIDLARPDRVIQISALDPHGLVESRGSRTLVATSTREGLVDGLVDREAAFVGYVVGPEVGPLVANGESPSAGRLADEAEHVVGVCGNEVVDILCKGFVACGGQDGWIGVGVGVEGSVGACGTARWPPGEKAKV